MRAVSDRVRTEEVGARDLQTLAGASNTKAKRATRLKCLEHTGKRCKRSQLADHQSRVPVVIAASTSQSEATQHLETMRCACRVALRLFFPCPGVDISSRYRNTVRQWILRR